MILSIGGNILVTQIKEKQVIMICYFVYYGDLFVILIKYIAIILDMDLLSDNGAQVDCGEKIVSI
jgi:hypothetical protein